MVVFTTCLLILIAGGVSGALSAASSNLFKSCTPKSSRDDQDAVDELGQLNVPVAAEPQQPQALSVISSREGSTDIIVRIENNVGGLLVLLQLQHGRHVFCVDSIASGVRLYNWASVWCPLRQRAVLHTAAKRVVLVLQVGGNSTTAKLPATTAMATALIPLPSASVPVFGSFGVVSPGPAATPAAISTTVLRTFSMFTPHLCSVGPPNADEPETQMADRESLRRQMIIALPRRLQYQHQFQKRPASKKWVESNALVRFDHSSGKTEATLTLLLPTLGCARPPPLNICLPATSVAGKIAALDDGSSNESASPMWSYPVSTSTTSSAACSMDTSAFTSKGGSSEAGGRCGFILDGCTGSKPSSSSSWSWSWSKGLLIEDDMPREERPTQDQQQQQQQQQQRHSEEGACPVEDESITMKDFMDNEDVVPKQRSFNISTTPPLTPASTTSPAADKSAKSRQKMNISFFAGTCNDGVGSTSSSTDASSSEEEPEAMPVKEHNEQLLAPQLRKATGLATPKVDVEAIQGSAADDPFKTAKFGQADANRVEETAAAAAEEEEEEEDESEAGEEVWVPKVKPEAGEFNDIVDGIKPGQLRDLLIRNLRESQSGDLGHACAAVRAAQVALSGNGEDAGVLHEGKVLGEGSFGIVKEARHTVLSGHYAVKRLKEDADWKARYCATVEMLVLARLAKAPHNNVISAVSIDDREGAIGMMMPILLPKAEVDFGTVIRHGGCSVAMKLRVLAQAASGVGHMHRQGIGHGDLKPGNILLVDDGQGGCVAKLCDFGMARALGEMRPQMMGTPAFMPLEVMLESVQTHPSQDVFAMGVMAFLVCVSPDKAQPNLFISPELYTAKEARKKKALEVQGGVSGCPVLAAQKRSFELAMMERTMSDGSLARLLTADHLHEDLGSSETKLMVSLCLPPFMDKDPTSRPGIANYEKVMGNLAVAVEESAAEDAEDQGRPEDQEPGTSDGDDKIGMDLEGDDDEYDDNELF